MIVEKLRYRFILTTNPCFSRYVLSHMRFNFSLHILIKNFFRLAVYGGIIFTLSDGAGLSAFLIFFAVDNAKRSLSGRRSFFIIQKANLLVDSKGVGVFWILNSLGSLKLPSAEWFNNWFCETRFLITGGEAIGLKMLMEELDFRLFTSSRNFAFSSSKALNFCLETVTCFFKVIFCWFMVLNWLPKPDKLFLYALRVSPMWLFCNWWTLYIVFIMLPRLLKAILTSGLMCSSILRVCAWGFPHWPHLGCRQSWQNMWKQLVR